MSAGVPLVIDVRGGAQADGAELWVEIDASHGSPSPELNGVRPGEHVETEGECGVNATQQDAEGVGRASEIDAAVGSLRSLTAMWEDVQRTRLAALQRGVPGVAEAMLKIETSLGRQIRRELEAHPVWPWLSQFPGLGGVHTARLVGLIGDPHRFPGRVCEEGHHHSAADRTREILDDIGCGVEQVDGTVCAAPVGPVRRGTGTRALWHYLGLHVVDGKMPKRRKGVKADWNPMGRTMVLMPGGIAEQIVRQRVPHYRGLYEAAKERLTRERSGVFFEIEPVVGPLPIHSPEAAEGVEFDASHGLRPIQIEKRARIIAAKAFVGDLLAEWKRV